MIKSTHTSQVLFLFPINQPFGLTGLFGSVSISLDLIAFPPSFSRKQEMLLNLATTTHLKTLQTLPPVA